MRIISLIFLLLFGAAAYAAFPHGGTLAPLQVPVNTVLPVISGTAQVGQTLTTTTGTWTNNPTSFSYFWQSGGGNTGTNPTYVPIVGDIAHAINVQVTASNAAGNSLPATSLGVGPVIAAGGLVADLNFAANSFTGGTVGSLISVARAAPATTYAETTSGSLTSFAANVARYTNKGLLVEEPRTNLVLNSAFGGSISTGNTTFTLNAATSPDGTTDAAFIKEDSTNNQHYITLNNGNFSTATNTQYTFSIYAASVGAARSLRFNILDSSFGGFQQVAMSLQNGQPTTTAASCVPASNGFWRCSWTFTTGSTSGLYLSMTILNAVNPAGAGVSFGINQTASNLTYTGDGSSGLNIYCPQLEQAAFATSCIPTTGSTVTRSADNVSLIGAAQTGLASSTGTAEVETYSGFKYGAAASLIDSNGTALLGFTSGDVLSDDITSSTASANTGNRWLGKDYGAVAWDGTGRNVVLNGGLNVTDAVAQTPSSTLHLGSTGTANFLDGYVSRLRVWNSKLVSPAGQFPLVAAQPDIWIYLAGPEGSGAQNGGYMPNAGDWTYMKNHGIKHGRLTVAWENFQSTAQLGTTTLNSNEVTAVGNALTTAAANGIDLVLDIQNYGWYCPTSTWNSTCFSGGNVGLGSPAIALDSGSLPLIDFTDLWAGLVAAFSPGGVPHAGLSGYELMNEPGGNTGLPNLTSWSSAAQNAINAIRAVDTTTPIWLDGDGNACRGTGITASGYCPPNVTGTNLVYAAHSYYDAPEGQSGGGTYGGSFTVTPSSYGVDNYTSVRAIQAILGWAKFSGKSIQLGEFGGVWTSTNTSWLEINAHTMAALIQAGVPGVHTFFGNAGAGGSTSNLKYNPSGENTGTDDQRFLQMTGTY